jgi:hypothetical protein
VKYRGDLGLGQFNASKIDVIGAKIGDVKKSYRMHPDIERELKWHGPLTVQSRLGADAKLSAGRVTAPTARRQWP